jgi:hypothetical protein
MTVTVMGASGRLPFTGCSLLAGAFPWSAAFASTYEYTIPAITTRGLRPRTPGIFEDSDGP